MKPLQIGLLMVAAAVGGALFMKWENRGTQSSVAAESTKAGSPAVPDETVSSVPVAPAEPASVPERRYAEPEPRRKVRTEPVQKHRAEEPVKMAAAPQSVPQITPRDAAPAAPPAQPTPAPAQPEPVRAEPAPPPPPPPPARVTLAAGTSIVVRTIDSLSSDRSSPGDSFSASLTQPLVVDGFVIAERGARAEGRVVQSQKGGRVKGGADLAIELTRITTADGQHIAIETESYQKVGATRTKEEAAKVGGGAALGAIIGAIAGGGKGAGIGAGAGSAAGAGDVLLTHGKAVTLPSESQITFRLRAPVTITERR